MHTTSIDFPDDVWEDIQKRKFRSEGSVKDLIIRSYRKTFMEVEQDEKNQPTQP